MDRTLGDNYAVVGGKRAFEDGPPGTVVEEVFMNGIQEEIVGVIEASGQTPSTADNAQLLNAIKYLTRANAYNYAVDSGAANAYVIALSPAPTTLTAGMIVSFLAGASNTGASTLNVNGLGAVSITRNGNGDALTGDITAGQIVSAIYDGTRFQIIGHDRPGFGNFKVFDASAVSQVWVVPSGVRTVMVEAWGGGGGGAGGGSAIGSPGGGGGGYGRVIVSVAPGNSLVMSVAASVSGGAYSAVAGTNGASTVVTDATWAVTLITATGGTGATAANAGTGGTSTATENIQGGRGCSVYGSLTSGAGGASPRGGSGGLGGSNAVTADVGVAPGGGGAGGSSAIPGAGGAGAQGRVVLWW